jgi:hypothetical protein
MNSLTTGSKSMAPSFWASAARCPMIRITRSIDAIELWRASGLESLI